MRLNYVTGVSELPANDKSPHTPRPHLSLYLSLCLSLSHSISFFLLQGFGNQTFGLKENQIITDW